MSYISRTRFFSDMEFGQERSKKHKFQLRPNSEKINDQIFS